MARRILVVEDDPDIAHLVELHLRDLGADVTLARVKALLRRVDALKLETRDPTTVLQLVRDAERMILQINKLKEIDLLRRELVANVSHDLRTPLASLQGYLDTLLLKEDLLAPDEQRKFLRSPASTASGWASS